MKPSTYVRGEFLDPVPFFLLPGGPRHSMKELFELVVSRYHWLEMVLMLLATGTGLDFEH